MKKLVSFCFIVAMALLMGCSDDNDSGNSGGSNNGSNQNNNNNNNNNNVDVSGVEKYCKKQSAEVYDRTVSKYDSVIKEKGLTLEQLLPLKDTLMEDCLGFLNGYPVCKSEIFAVYSCDYSDETTNAENAEVEKCENAYQACDRSNDDCDEKYNACIDAIPDFCSKQRDSRDACYDANEQALMDYRDNTDSTPKTDEALKALGIDPKDLEQ